MSDLMSVVIKGLDVVVRNWRVFTAAGQCDGRNM